MRRDENIIIIIIIKIQHLYSALKSKDTEVLKDKDDIVTWKHC